MPRRYDQGFRKLIAWQEAKKLTLKIYALTKKFPKEELFILTSQLRRASTSIMANIAEGSAMMTKAHRVSFYMRARGSAVEVDNFLEVVFELRYISKEEFEEAVDHAARVSYLITQLMNG